MQKWPDPAKSLGASRLFRSAQYRNCQVRANLDWALQALERSQGLRKGTGLRIQADPSRLSLKVR